MKYLVNASTRYPALCWYLMHHVRHGLGYSPAQTHAGITDQELPRIMIEMFTSTPWDAAQLSLRYWISCESDEIRIFQGKRDRAVLEMSAGTHGLLPAPAVRSVLRSSGSDDAVENGAYPRTSRDQILVISCVQGSVRLWAVLDHCIRVVDVASVSSSHHGQLKERERWTALLGRLETN